MIKHLFYVEMNDHIIRNLNKTALHTYYNFGGILLTTNQTKFFTY